MTASDLKFKIFRQIDSPEKHRPEKFYGLLLNYHIARKTYLIGKNLLQ